jgi:hypothetical protein
MMYAVLSIWKAGEEGIEQPGSAARLAGRERARQASGRQVPDHPGGIEPLDGAVPLGERSRELDVQIEVAPPPAAVPCAVAAERRRVGDGHQDEVREPEPAGVKSTPAGFECACPVVQGRVTGAPERPGIVELERVAVADGDAERLFNPLCPFPACAVEPRPELGSRQGVLRGGCRLGGGGLGDHDGGIAVACGPRGLAGGARAFDDDDHAAIVAAARS